MKKVIKKWLGITSIEEGIYRLNSDVSLFNAEISIKKTKTNEEIELERNLKYSIGILNALLDYFELDFRKTMVIDNRVMRDEVPMTQIIEVFKKKK